MREVLAERGTVATATSQWHADRDDNYRGRKDSALALYYLWRIGEAMTHHRERFERVYALTETVAPRELIRESDPENAEDYLMTKEVASNGLAPMRTVGKLPAAQGVTRRTGGVAAPESRGGRAARGAGRGLAGPAGCVGFGPAGPR